LVVSAVERKQGNAGLVPVGMETMVWDSVSGYDEIPKQLLESS